ncbi:hypothetical protein FRC07_008247, partial [Ceratobasidium sp. 392]
MLGAIEGPLPPSTSLLAPSASSGLVPSSSHTLRNSRTLPSANSSSEKESSTADVSLELDVDRISSVLGARLVVGFVELVMYLKGQLLKSLHALNEDLPSTFETLESQQTVTLALVFGLGRAKSFVRLSGTDFAKPALQDALTDTPDEDTLSSRTPRLSDENADSETQTPKRRLSSRSPLQDITPSASTTTNEIDILASKLASTSLKPLSSEAGMRKTERALAQAIACSDIALGENLGPMGAQIYMRAPRSFRHPKWVVRPDAARTLDAP